MIATDSGQMYESEVDLHLDQQSSDFENKPIISGGQAFRGKTTDKVPDTSSFINNAPASSRTPWRGNLGDILGMDVHDIPGGMSAREFYQHLKSIDDKQYQRRSMTDEDPTSI